jgi:nucleoside-diphosphate-sugar epimerase
MATNELHVIFGSGPLGVAVMKELVQRGKQVRLVNRSGKVHQNGFAGVQVMAGDAYNLDFTREACRGATVVYQCAQPPYHEWVEKFPTLQQSILEGAASAGAKFIVGENLYMYGEVNGPMHEGLPYSARTRKGKVRGEMAHALLAAHQSGKVRTASARGSDFYGPQVLDSTLGERAIVPALQGNSASLTGHLDLPHTYTYVDDFGKAMVILGEREEALGQAWHVPNPPTLTQRQLMGLFFEEIGKPPRMSGMGKLMISISGMFIPEARETVEMMYEFEKPFVVDDKKFKQAFDDIAASHHEAVKATVAWYRDHMNGSLHSKN